VNDGWIIETREDWQAAADALELAVIASVHDMPAARGMLTRSGIDPDTRAGRVILALAGYLAMMASDTQLNGSEGRDSLAVMRDIAGAAPWGPGR
jgi:hypothetical protein